MKRLWLKFAEKIDSFSLRERALVFFGAAFAVMLAAEAVVLRPLVAQQRNMTQEIARKQSEMRSLQSETQKLVILRGEDPDAAARRKLAQLKDQIAELERQIQQKQSQFVPADRIAKLMEEMLGRNPRVDLLDMRTLAVAPISGADTDKIKLNPAAKAEKGIEQPGGKIERRIYRHGVELAVRGSYLDLLGYVSSLEGMPLRMYWSKLDLATESYPSAILKLTVFTLSFDKAWLIV